MCFLFLNSRFMGDLIHFCFLIFYNWLDSLELPNSIQLCTQKSTQNKSSSSANPQFIQYLFEKYFIVFIPKDESPSLNLKCIQPLTHVLGSTCQTYRDRHTLHVSVRAVGQQEAIFFRLELLTYCGNKMWANFSWFSCCFQAPYTCAPLLPVPGRCSCHPESGHWQPLLRHAALSSDGSSIESSPLTIPSKVGKSPLLLQYLSENLQFTVCLLWVSPHKKLNLSLAHC